MFEELFYTRLTWLRNQKGVSAREMSLSIGQNAGYINGLENHGGLPSMTLFFYICEYLGVSPSEFFDAENEAPLHLRETIKDLCALDRNTLEHVAVLLKDLKR